MSDSPLPGQVEEKEMQEMDPEKGATSGPISASSQSDVISTNNILASMPSKTSQWSGMSSRRRGRSARHRSARSSRGARPAVLDVEGQEQDQVDQLAEEIAEGKMAIRDMAKPMDTKREMLQRSSSQPEKLQSAREAPVSQRSSSQPEKLQSAPTGVGAL
ncbi:Hypp5081 [Branchiostoma lanceolatum]|uniref:Hypp5081 protein n=1 Tax=Branchiostoma lanceolatum TaxID=7740 RepID=A0A8K0ACA2_BRALA|nr:Hypp5081 [Branchiostoma lanceolatum]